MLEQAVIDAQTLREAAIKNAEQEVLVKYSSEIREAVDSILEQEDELAGGMEDLSMDAAEDAEIDPIVNSIPLKATEGQSGIESPLKGEDIELNLDELRASINADQNTDNLEDELMFETTKLDLEELLSSEMNEGEEELKESEGEEELKESEDEEEISISEESLKDAIEEILKVDYENVPRGELGTTHPTRVEQAYALEASLARAEDTEVEENNKESEKAIEKYKKLEEQVKSLKSDKNRLVTEHTELKSVARQVSDKLTELNLTNAKLVYQNRILKSSSLNERQKDKLVDAISKANSIDEAKVIFETLQDSLSSRVHNSPKNLSEAVSKNNRLILKSNITKVQADDSTAVRMKKLAGII